MAIIRDDEVELSELADRIHLLLSQFSHLAQTADWTPTPESPCVNIAKQMRRETGPALSWDGSDAGLASQMAFVLLHASAKYLAGAQVLIRNGQVEFALAPVVRSMFEAMGRVAWLLDPDVDTVRKQAARVKLLWLEELSREEENRRAVGQSAERKKVAAARKAAKIMLRRHFRDDEILESEPTDGSSPLLSVCGQSLPSLRQSVHHIESVYKSAWGAKRFYDTLSTVSHPHVLSILSMVQIQQDPDVPVGTFNFGLPNAEYPTVLANNAALVFVDTWRLFLGFNGQPDAGIADFGAPFRTA